MGTGVAALCSRNRRSIRVWFAFPFLSELFTLPSGRTPVSRPCSLTGSRFPAALTHGAALTQNRTLFTVVETPTFTRLWPDYWDEDERGEFVAWLVKNAEAGTVIRGSGSCRKVRWKRAGTGKRGGVRVIH